MPALAAAPVVPASPAAPEAAESLPVQRQRTLAHAARHDILRRIAPSLRHDMVVHLQSLGMMAEALGARIERGTAGGDDLQAGISKLNRLARKAVETCVEVATWMEPSEDDTVALRAGVDEGVRLLRSSLNFRGFALGHEVGDDGFEVGRSALRFLLPAAIFLLVDAATGPGGITVRAESSATHAVLVVGYEPEPDGSVLHEGSDTPLSWAEVQALAACESVEIRRAGQQVVLRFPRAVATKPLKMVPVV